MPDQPGLTADQIGEYYDDIGGLVELVGGNLHVGYWEDGDRGTFLAGLLRLTSMLEERLEPRAGQRVLDVGCGVGEPAVRIAQHHDVRITGITLSHWQVREATRRVISGGVRGQVEIEHADATALPYPDASFDAVLAFDSLANAEDKGRWLSEMFRVLRPGGRCVFTDYPRLSDPTDAEMAVLRDAALFDPAPAGEIVKRAEAAGFEILEALECARNVRRYYDEVLVRLESLRPVLDADYGPEKMAMFEQALKTSYGICRERLGYLIVTCRKPGA
ncbi:methyltransferase domain-containing protein [Actinomadura geliboluensis]|jgi:ubiquinone/menaquinone biosynthesis C-methylase UbiE|uniref:Methyltransferase domain-containing protein n=1 Tax=Actinomadura geliboluensis TaxID=882440 RepID=A0A5S4GRX6_9ACTN|nr:methyltransferase domain-containing protein [Actinomadura geliboluensis]TMR35716.1 methyltransferase domain-containing protein [Actinomadura geliboluensis]